MTTLAKTYHAAERSNSYASTGLLARYHKLIEKLDFTYFGLISMTILIGSIIGGIAAMFILQANAPIWELGICLAISMANNVAAIGQAPTKWVVNLFSLTLLINVVLILVNAI